MTTTVGTGRRTDGRVPNQLRPVKIVPDYLKFAEGSVLIRVGDTRVICAATIEDRVPGWMRGKGRGWVTAEYSMLPRAGTERSQREAARGSIGGRTHEIQRLIGRSLRGVVDMGEARRAHDHPRLRRDPGRWRHAHGQHHRRVRGAGAGAATGTGWAHLLTGQVAAVSVGLVQRRSRTSTSTTARTPPPRSTSTWSWSTTTGSSRCRAPRSTAPSRRQQMDQMIDLAAAGIRQLFTLQRTAIEAPPGE